MSECHISRSAFQPKSGMVQYAIKDFGLTIYASSDIRDFGSVWPLSNQKSDARRYAFQNADFLVVWLSTIGRARKTHSVFVGVFDASGHPIALLPLGIEARSGLRILTFLDGGVVDYNCPVLFPSSQNLSTTAVASLWIALRRVIPPFDVALLEKMPADVEDCKNPLSALEVFPFSQSGYFTTLASMEDKVGVRLPFAQDTRRNTRRLGEIGKLTFETARTPEDRDRFLAAMIRQKTRRYIETRGTDSFNRPGYRAFFKEATLRFAEAGFLHLSAVLVDGKILATHWGYVVGSRFYYLMPSYEGGEWPRYSPGRLLLHWLMEWSATNGLIVFDQGIGDEQYKARYCDGVIALFHLEQAFTIKGRTYLMLRRSRRMLVRGPLWNALRSVVRALRRIKKRRVYLFI